MLNLHLSKIKNLRGWGNFPKSSCSIYEPASLNDISLSRETKIIARGFGRSYGDSSLQPKATLITKKINKIISFDKESGIIKTQAGISSKKLLETIIPDGWFLPVSPGTKFVSVGGMVASDVHGKNHHIEGSFGNHVSGIKLLLNENEVVYCSPKEKSDLFWATIGGMGLTGIILEVEFKLKKICSSSIDQQVFVTNNLKETIEIFREHQDATYSIAWIDCITEGKNFGRSILFTGEHSSKRNGKKLLFKSKTVIKWPFNLPSWFLNKFFIKIFNNFYFYKNKNFKKKEVDLDSYFFPLDKILNWNKLYGKNGFIQYQFVIPLKYSEEALNLILRKVLESRDAPFLTTLKLFGEKNDGLLSFPQKGFTLAMDFPIRKGTLNLLNELDEIVIKFNGKIYLTKDSRLNARNFHRMESSLTEFNKIREKYNCLNFESLQSSRLKI